MHARSSIIPIYLIILTLGFSVSCNNQPDEVVGEDEKYVTVIIAEEVFHRRTIKTSGRLTPLSELKLSFKTGGLISHIPVNEGDFVRRGDLLASLDLSEIRSQLKQSELMHQKALRDFERITNLYNDTVATLEQLQNAETALKMAESTKTIAKFNMEHSVINAPSDGQILKIVAEENENIAPGYPVLVFASSINNWLLKVAVTDKDVIHISEGDDAMIMFDAYPQTNFTASVVEIPGMADPYTGTFEIGLALSSESKRLITGFIGKAEIITSIEDRYILIPASSLAEANGMKGTVFKYKNGKAIKSTIKIKEIVNENFLVEGELASGDTIIMEGSKQVSEGDKILISDIDVGPKQFD